MKRLTKRQILDETIAFYKADPSRLAKGGPPGVEIGGSFVGCNYITDDGRKCAVGRCMINPEPWANGVMEQWKCIEDLDEELKEEYRGHSLIFWKTLQALHDYAAWDRENSIEKYAAYVDCRMTMPEIVEETIQYYLEDPSRRAYTIEATGHVKCWYYMEGGRMCAVGRCMIDASSFATCTYTPHQIHDLESQLKPDYRGHSAEFWMQLQKLHDTVDWSLGEEAIYNAARALNLLM